MLWQWLWMMGFVYLRGRVVGRGWLCTQCTHLEEMPDDKETLEKGNNYLRCYQWYGSLHLFERRASHGARKSITSTAYDPQVLIATVWLIYSDFDPVARRALEVADPEGFRIWILVEMDDFPNWSTNHEALLGDACRYVSPFGFWGLSWLLKTYLHHRRRFRGMRT